MPHGGWKENILDQSMGSTESHRRMIGSLMRIGAENRARSVPLRRMRCQSLIFLPTAFFALVLIAGEKPTKSFPCRFTTRRPRKV